MKLTHDEAAERIAGVLKASGITARIGGCSCCGVFEVEFPDGAKHESDSVYIECDGISHQRG
ncbi:MAG: hypothetical protein ACHP7H_00490 [Hyphomicrobiales bacterium]